MHGWEHTLASNGRTRRAARVTRRTTIKCFLTALAQLPNAPFPFPISPGQLFLLLWLSIPSGFLVVFEKPSRSSFTFTFTFIYIYRARTFGFLVEAVEALPLLLRVDPEAPLSPEPPLSSEYSDSLSSLEPRLPARVGGQAVHSLQAGAAGCM